MTFNNYEIFKNNIFKNPVSNRFKIVLVNVAKTDKNINYPWNALLSMSTERPCWV